MDNEKKNILFISPDVGGFYKDIIDEMNRQGYNVDYIRDLGDDRDPDHVRGVNYNKGEKYKELVLNDYDKFWEESLSRATYSKKYDILFVIDGRKMHPTLFKVLRERNPHLYAINYLFDTTRSIYRFNVNFQYFDKVITFDKQDAKTFNLEVLPIPWSETAYVKNIKYTFFAMGAYIESRYNLFKFVEQFSKLYNKKCFVSIYTKKIKYYLLKYVANYFIHKHTYLPPSIYYSKIVTTEFIPKEKFMQLMLESEVIVDSIDERQDGLTARCTWALGAGKKIITNNKSILTYDFYTPEQILVIDKITENTTTDLMEFMSKELVLSKDTKEKINKFRIDNWVKYLLNY